VLYGRGSAQADRITHRRCGERKIYVASAMATVVVFAGGDE